MKVVALISGGKDSCYNMMLSVANGHEIIALANLKPEVSTGKDELDSFMYQTVGHDAIHHYAECMGLPLFRREIKGSSLSQTSDYRVTKDDETEDLFELLLEVKTRFPDVEGVSVGAILSNYQRVRVEHVCRRLGLTSLAFLWRRKQKGLLKEMVEANVEAIIIKVAAIGLDEQHLGKTLGEMYPHLCDMHERYDLHICGEGGEYETFCLDCPLFTKKIVIDETETVVHSNDAFAPVLYLRLKKLRVVEKQEKQNEDWKQKVNAILVAERAEGDASLVHRCVYESANYYALQYQSHPGINRDIDSAAMALAKARITGSVFRKQNIGIVSSKPPYHFFSGCTAYDTENDDDPEVIADIGEETRIVMQHLEERLSRLGLSWQNVVMTHVFVSDMNDFGIVNKEYGAFFDVNPPARATVQLDLPSPVKVQIDCIAVETVNQSNLVSTYSTTATSANESKKSHQQFKGIEKTETMHVQGVSMWAPANIGPYSQACMSQGQAYLAGQIGLVPNTMSLPSLQYSPDSPVSNTTTDNQLLAEVEQSLLNLKAVVEAMGCRLESDTALCLCYIAANGVMSFEKGEIEARKKAEEVVMGSWDHLREALAPLHSNSSRTPTSPPMLCVWVPALPRNARVEWEVILSMPMRVLNICEGEIDEEGELRLAVGVEKDQLYDEKGLKVRYKAWSRGTVHIGKLTGCVLPTFLPKHIQEYAGDLVGKIVAGVGYLTETLRIMSDDAISFRVYYSVVSRAAVVEAFERKLGSAVCGIPTSQIAITYIPVLKIGNYGLISVVVQAASVGVRH